MKQTEQREDSIFTVKSQKGFQARNALFDAAVPLIAEHGVTGFSINDLCKKANLKRTSFYTYFSSLETLVDELSKREDAEFEKTIEREFGAVEPGIQRLCLNMLGFFISNQEESTWNRCVTQMFVHHTPTRDAITADMKNDIKCGIDAGDLTIQRDEVDNYAALFYGTLIASVSSRHLQQLDQQQARSIVKMLLRAGGVEPKKVENFLNHSKKD